MPWRRFFQNRLELSKSFRYYWNYGTLNAAELRALGHESRLGIFRLLIEAGPKAYASAIGEQLAMAPATLSFHLAHLSRVGLIQGERAVSSTTTANFATMDELIAFLTRNCCQRSNVLPRTVCCDTTTNAAAEQRLARNNGGIGHGLVDNGGAERFGQPGFLSGSPCPALPGARLLHRRRPVGAGAAAIHHPLPRPDARSGCRIRRQPGRAACSPSAHAPSSPCLPASTRKAPASARVPFLFFAPAANILALSYTGVALGADFAIARILLALCSVSVSA